MFIHVNKKQVLQYKFVNFKICQYNNNNTKLLTNNT